MWGGILAKQTGSIGLAASNSVKLYAEAGFDNIEQNYYSKSDFTISPSQITSKITELTNSTGSLIQRTNTLEQTVTGITQVLEGKVDSDEPWVSWLHAGADETTHEPYLAMGQDSDYPSVKYTGSAAKFYNGQGNSDSNIIAQFGANGALIGRVGEAHTSISSDKTIFYGADGLEAANISMSAPGTTIARATYSVVANGTTTVSKTITNILPMPDFTLGEMASYGNMQLTITINDVMVGAYNISSLTDPVSSPHSGNYTTSFQASQGTEGWNFMMEVQGTTNEDTDEIVYHLEWLYSGSGPMFNFGTAMMSGAYAFSVGNGNVVTQENSVALGLGLITNSPAQIVVGKYNKPEKWASFIVGNGFNDTSRSNAFWIDNQGTAHVTGFIQDSNTPVLSLSTEAKQSWQHVLDILPKTGGTISGNLSVTGSITIGNHAGPIGSTTSASGTVSVAAQEKKAACSVSLNPGKWVVTGNVYFKVLGSGYRVLSISSTSGSISNGATYHTIQLPGVSGYYSMSQVVAIIENSSTTRYYLNVQAESAATIEGCLRAIRIA